ncbi:hypothetical protein Sta7437_1815 [Stanieria cyanosphaera PCC 7437]|uniref:DUF3598 domain-containing protein n=1 Tax=Stanieria cyanosphaera (strain ATCC 29371 / PCC 7437) TaxID=111780 RepID=K9XS63_STAC7|nr:DUF3598 family protein [Stanieria cyanosphaera]AFZ35373.1 hypothetical protein Sta7437_1815 [Stanieria cyanosphaera PCC 7437]
MIAQETNWFNLFGQYVPEKTTWHALTTVYSIELEVIRSYKFTRTFSTNADKSIIYHHNIYYLPDNQIKEQSWKLERQKCNQPDGVFHPEAENMRAIGFGNETSIWISKTFSHNHNFGSEVFFQQQDWRYSVIPVYEGGNLSRIVTIKENKQHFPTQINEEKITNLSGKWQLKQIKMKPDLKTSNQEFASQEIQNSVFIKTNQNYFLPEKIILNVPSIIPMNQTFEMLVGKQITDNLYKQIKVQYNSSGKLSELTSEVYQLDASR